MSDVLTNKSSSIVNDIATLGSFLAFGAVSGFLFALLVTRAYLQEFFFIKTDKFLIPRYSYWFAFSLLQLFGLAGAYLVCVSRRWIVQISRLRAASLLVVIGLTTPVLRLITPAMNSRIGLNWDFIVAPIVFIFLLSVALCIFSGTFRVLPIAVLWNLLFLAAGILFVYTGIRLIDGSRDWYEFVQWSILESMLALSFGNWFIWRRRVNAS